MRVPLINKTRTAVRLILTGHIGDFGKRALNEFIRVARYRLDLVETGSYQYGRFRSGIPLACSLATVEEVSQLFALWPDGKEEYERHYEVYFKWGFRNCFIYRNGDTQEALGFCFLLTYDDRDKIKRFLPKKLFACISSEECAGHEWLYIFEKFRRLGILSEGTDHVVRYCQEKGIKKLYSHRGVSNVPSIRFADKIGYRPIGMIYHVQLLGQRRNRGIYWMVRGKRQRVALQMPGNLRKILIIAYHFPPDAAVGALRPQKFAKYLPEFGWEPYVLTIKEKYIEEEDAGRLADVANVPIFRTRFIRNPLRFYFHLRDKIFGPPKSTSPGTEGMVLEAGLLPTTQRIKKFIAEIFYLPDYHLFWAITAVAKGVSLVKRYNINYVYETSPPRSVDIIGYLISRLTGKKLIVDHRDPWALCGERKESKYIVRIHHALERTIFDRASCILTTSEKYAQKLRELSGANSNKIHNVYNGYDDDDFGTDEAQPPQDAFVLTYLGKLYLKRSPLSFLKAAGALTREDAEIAGRLRINFVGSGREFKGISLEQIIAEEGLTDKVRFLDQVPYRSAIEIMRKSHVLLIFASEQHYQIPGKTFDYIASRRPILAFTEEDSSTADLIRKFRAGIVVPLDDIEGIREGILRLYQERTDGSAYYQDVDISTLKRKRQTQQLAEFLDDIC